MESVLDLPIADAADCVENVVNENSSVESMSHLSNAEAANCVENGLRMSGSTEVKEICEKGDDVEEKDKCTIVRGNVGLTEDIPEKAKSAVLVESAPLPEGTPIVQGYDFNKGVNYHALLETFRFSGFQATNFGLAVEEIKRMITCRRQPLSEELQDKLEEDEFIKRKTNCTIFFGYTSNMISAGVRDTIRFLVQHNLVDCVVTTAGGIEEDFIKCLAPTYIGDFHLDGRRLREKGINRIGNLLVPNENYCRFEDWVMPILDKMLQEQKEKGTLWTPSKMVARLGEEINNPDSVYYWAAKNKIPVFSPALTDGSLGDMMYFHSYKNPGLVLDIVQDLRRLNTMAVKAANTGMIIIGGGVIKHHICNANLMRNGADYAVFINTASEFDGSDSGARPDEAISWGKIRKDASPVKVYAEASLVFPLLVGETFAKQYHATKEKTISDV